VQGKVILTGRTPLAPTFTLIFRDLRIINPPRLARRGWLNIKITIIDKLSGWGYAQPLFSPIFINPHACLGGRRRDLTRARFSILLEVTTQCLRKELLMKLIAVRHGEFLPSNDGKPTRRALREFLKRFSKTTIAPRMVCGNAPRALILATRACKRWGTKPDILPEFNPLQTIKVPSLFGGWLYELIHRSQSQMLNWLALILWWIGFPIFTERPMKFLNRTKDGLKIIQKQNLEEVVLVCHRETIVALMIIINRKGPLKAIRMGVKYFETFVFKI